MKSNIEKRSRHYGDTYQWVLKVIKSCKTDRQKIKCRRLIDNWYSQTRRQYPHLDDHTVMNMERTLQFELHF